MNWQLLSDASTPEILFYYSATRSHFIRTISFHLIEAPFNHSQRCWLWATTHVRKVVGSNPGAIYWMDIFSRLFVVKIVMFVWGRPKINEKEAGIGPIF